MQINNVRVKAMHGFIDAELTLNDELAIIVGANGAGKTSLLSLTANLLKLNVPGLAAISFETVVLRGRSEKKAVEISCARSQRTLTFVLKESGKLIDKQSLKLPLRDEAVFETRLHRLTYERSLRRMFDALSGTKLAEYLRDRVRLTLVRLDRTLFAEENDGSVSVDSPAVVHRGGEEPADPTDRVEQVTRDRYNQYRISLRKHNEELTRQVVLQLFKVPKNLFSAPRGSTKLNAAQIEGIRRKVTQLPYFADTEEFTGQIKDYFELAISSLETGVAGAEQNAIRMLFREFEFPRIHGLVTAFERFEAEDASARRELDRFERLINSFLVEGGKEVFFSESEASIRFRLKGSSTGVGRPIRELSSGEKQIVIMLTYLAFMAGDNCIFVVDEPELSLHLSWQRKLVGALLEIRPNDSQLIFATHSPEIVAKHQEAIVSLIPEYSEVN